MFNLNKYLNTHMSMKLVILNKDQNTHEAISEIAQNSRHCLSDTCSGHKFQNATNCWHFKIFDQIILHNSCEY